MESFQWDPCFLTGLTTVDEQHHRLVDLINRYGDLLLQPRIESAPQTETVFRELADYARYHFREEEAEMARHELDRRHVSRHRDEHALFLEDVKRMHEGLASDSQDDGGALIGFLSNWLAFHILGTDRLMAWLVAAKASGQSQQDAYQSFNLGRDPATATLLRALHKLFDHARNQNRRLSELNQTLEARIDDRTQALTQANHRLETMAMTDVLTGLPNRRHALAALERRWHESLASEIPLACMMVDADGFKAVNDAFGHDAGDAVLRQLSRALKGAVRNDDVVCRLGGDEFLIICTDTALDGAMLAAEKIRHAVSMLRVRTGDGIWKGSISVGVAVRNSAMTGVEQLLKAADRGVYIAKRNGRNGVATA